MLHHPYTCIANNLSTKTPVILRASRVPASRLGRLFHYGCKLLPRPLSPPFRQGATDKEYFLRLLQHSPHHSHGAPHQNLSGGLPQETAAKRAVGVCL